jgi:tRNA-dihydrouridine synthase
VPVIANGDIIDSATAQQAMDQSGADGVMVGRGAQGKPWLLAQIAADTFGGQAPEIPEGDDLAELVAKHYEDMLAFYGVELGSKVARKHLGWYMDGANTAKDMRRVIQTANDPKLVLKMLPEAFAGGGDRKDAA